MRSTFVVMRSDSDSENPLMAYACAKSYIPDLKPFIFSFPRVEKKDDLFPNRTDYTKRYVFGLTSDDVVDNDSIELLLLNFRYNYGLTSGMSIPSYRSKFMDLLHSNAELFAQEDVVFFSVFRHHLLYHMILAAEIKNINRRTKIVFGGPQVILSSRTRRLLNNADFVDKILVGDIEGIESYKEDKKIIHIKKAESFRIPDYGNYNRIFHNTINLFTSRGCKWGCRYCPNGSNIIPHSVVDLKTVDRWIYHYRYNNIYFTDPYINYDGNRFTQLLEIMKKYRTGYTMWLHSVRLGYGHILDLEVIRPKRIWMSYDIVDKDLAKKMNRPTDKDIDHKIKALTDTGINTVVPFIVGLPDETDETFQKTFDKIKELLSICNNNLQIEAFPYLHNVGSPLFQRGPEYIEGVSQGEMRDRMKKIKGLLLSHNDV